MKTKSGFTLAELLITVTIIIVLALAILIGLNPMAQLFKGYDARRKADLHDLRTAFEAYYEDHECYPPISILQNCGSADLDPYLKRIPCDPQTQKPYELTVIPENACPQRYAIYSDLMAPNDNEAKYPECPQVMAVTSPNMTYVETVNACTKQTTLCPTYYGCRKGLCVAVAIDKSATCGPNYCDNDCGGVNCAQIIRGRYINECVAF